MKKLFIFVCLFISINVLTMQQIHACEREVICQIPRDEEILDFQVYLTPVPLEAKIACAVAINRRNIATKKPSASCTNGAGLKCDTDKQHKTGFSIPRSKAIVDFVCSGKQQKKDKRLATGATCSKRVIVSKKQPVAPSQKNKATTLPQVTQKYTIAQATTSLAACKQFLAKQ